jgi:hypothetical protein
MEKQLEEFLKGKIKGFRLGNISVSYPKNGKVVFGNPDSPRHYTLHLGGHSGFADIHSTKQKGGGGYKTLFRIPHRHLLCLLVRFKKVSLEILIENIKRINAPVLAKAPFLLMSIDLSNPIAAIPLFQLRKKKIDIDFEKFEEIERMIQDREDELYMSCEKFVQSGCTSAIVLHPETLEYHGCLGHIEHGGKRCYFFLRKSVLEKIQDRFMCLCGEFLKQHSVIPFAVWLRFLSRQKSENLRTLIPFLDGRLES